MKEVWKDITGYEGLYQISNLGRVKSFWNTKEKILMNLKDNFGYLKVCLCKDGKKKQFKVHKLVAEAYIPNIENKKEVNHINGNKADNRAENLEWCTRSENMKHAYKNGLQKPTEKQKQAIKKYCKENKTKKIIQLDNNGDFIKEWNSGIEVEMNLGINRKNISQCLTKRSKTAGGFKWEYKKEV